MAEPFSRRRLLGAGALGVGGLLLAGCDRLNRTPGFRTLLESAEDAHLASQRLIGGGALAPEFTTRDLSPDFRANGSRTAAGNTAWDAHIATGFRDWTLRIDGLVLRPLDLSLEALKGLPQRSQITKHDCVEGWSAIGKWQGPLLGDILKTAGINDRAKYIVFHCADDSNGAPYYESIDLYDAFHPQTIMALLMNNKRLEIGHGAPIRLRAERHLGYKQAKFVMRIEARDRIDNLYAGKGGYWEDASDYAWYAGI